MNVCCTGNRPFSSNNSGNLSGTLKQRDFPSFSIPEKKKNKPHRYLCNPKTHCIVKSTFRLVPLKDILNLSNTTSNNFSFLSCQHLKGSLPKAIHLLLSFLHSSTQNTFFKWQHTHSKYPSVLT